VSESERVRVRVRARVRVRLNVCVCVRERERERASERERARESESESEERARASARERARASWHFFALGTDLAFVAQQPWQVHAREPSAAEHVTTQRCILLRSASIMKKFPWPSDSFSRCTS
jgi:hypothetical protein